MSFQFADVENIYKNDPKLDRNDVMVLKDWADKQPHFPNNVSELQAILFVQSCHYSVVKAKTALDNFFTVRTLCPEIFGNRNPQDPLVKTAIDIATNTVLPNKTREGYAVCYSTLLDNNPDLYHFPVQFRIFDMSLMQHLYTHGPNEGFCIVLDMHGGQFGHLTKFNPVTVKKVLYYLQEAMPIRMKSIHFINTVSLVDKLVAIGKPFMKKELLDMVHIHSSTLDTFYQFVPKELLPTELGGHSGMKRSLQEAFKRNLTESREIFSFEESQKIDESKRPGKPRDVGELFGIDGTFKQLQVD